MIPGNDETQRSINKEDKPVLRPVPKFISNKSSKVLPPLEKEPLRRPKSTKLLPLKEEGHSVKTIESEK